jgi:hypothetical protein
LKYFYYFKTEKVYGYTGVSSYSTASQREKHKDLQTKKRERKKKKIKGT